MSDPVVRAKHKAAVREHFADPQNMSALIERGRRNSAGMWTKCDRQKAGRTRSLKRLGWCPIDLRPLYVKARREFGAKRARHMIEEQMAVDARRAALRLRQSRERLIA
jgi:hypothetical protein